MKSNKVTKPLLTPKQLFSLLHGWIGGISGAFVLCVAVTGIGLAFFGELAELQYGDMVRAEKPTKYASPETMVNSAVAGHEGLQPMGLFMPDTRMENLETALVYGMATDEQGEPGVFLASIDPGTGEYKGSFDLHKMFAHEFNDFHFTLLAGDIGKLVISVLSILIILFALTGIYLWWPRKGKAPKKLVTLETKGRWHSLWFNWHGLSGIWLGLLIVFYSLTGLALSEPDWFGPALANVEDPKQWEDRFRNEDCGHTVSIDEAFETAKTKFPTGTLSHLQIVDRDQFKYVFHFKRQGDMDARFGDAQAQVHAKCEDVVWSNELSDNDLPTIIGNQMLSLHGAHFLPGILPALITALTSLALTLLSISGLYIFTKRTIPSTKGLLKRVRERRAA